MICGFDKRLTRLRLNSITELIINNKNFFDETKEFARISFYLQVDREIARTPKPDPPSPGFWDVLSFCHRTDSTHAIMGDSHLFADTFTLTELNSQKYDRVSRLSSHTENGDTLLTLDVNTELFPCAVGERLHILLASTLSLDGSKDDGKGWRDVGRGESSLADEYDYVCHGKIYRFEEGDDENM